MVKDHFRGASHNGCFAVFDGHGGQRAAEYARERLAPMLEAHPNLETNVMGSISDGKCQIQLDAQVEDLTSCGRQIIGEKEQLGSHTAVLTDGLGCVG